MLDEFFIFKKFLQPENVNAVRTDNLIFRLHYRATSLILLMFSVIVTFRQYFGDPITCISEHISPKIMNEYCWFHSTFTLPHRMNGQVGFDVIAPGVAPYIKDHHKIKYHKYYQWVYFVFILQAIIFYLPHYLWKNFEQGRLKMLVGNLKYPLLSDKVKTERIQLIVVYFKKNLNMQNLYAYVYFICEILNFVNVACQVWLINWFFDGQFLKYGLYAISIFNRDYRVDRVDTMSEVFPKVTKCIFHSYGQTGSVQNYDGLCILPLNIVNEKIYLFLWFWLALVFTVTGLLLLYRFLAIFIFRESLLCRRAHCDLNVEIRSIMKISQIGDWFLLYRLGVNINRTVYRELINELYKSLCTDILV